MKTFVNILDFLYAALKWGGDDRAGKVIGTLSGGVMGFITTISEGFDWSFLFSWRKILKTEFKLSCIIRICSFIIVLALGRG